MILKKLIKIGGGQHHRNGGHNHQNGWSRWIGLYTGATISNLIAQGNSIQWYSASSGGTVLANSTQLTNGMHYYASQSINGYESSDRLNVLVTINNLPVKPIISQTGTQLITQSGLTNYQWFKGDINTMIPNETRNNYNPSSSGEYFVKVTNIKGCSNISDAFHYIITAVNNLNNNEFVKLYPNPADGILNVKFEISNLKRINIEIIDLNGKKIFEKIISSGETINISILSSGIYTIRVLSIRLNKIYYSTAFIKMK